MTDLESLTADIRACRICADRPTGKPLPHAPRPVLRVSQSARLCVAGQAPGVRVHASGTPFTDPSGDRLRAWMGVTPEEFYDDTRIAIVPMGFCFPGHDTNGGDLPPRRDCADRWRARLFELMPQLELVLAIGQYAQGWHLGHARKENLTATVAAWRSFGPHCMPLPHPSWRNNTWLRKNPWFEVELLPALKCEVRRLLG